MTTLLTLNGIPPQVLAAFDEEAQESIIHSAWIDRHNCELRLPPPEFLHDIVKPLVASFKSWGATVGPHSHASMLTTSLRTGEFTFPDESQLHADNEDAVIHLRHNLLSLRILAVSSDPARFIDATHLSGMNAVLNEYRETPGSRIFRPDFMRAAEGLGAQIITPAPWDIMVFDATTPHLPTHATYANYRIFLHAWIRLNLPANWRERIQEGDVPRWSP